MAQAVEAPSALDGMADGRASGKLFSLSCVFVQYLLQMEVAPSYAMWSGVL